MLCRRRDSLGHKNEAKANKIQDDVGSEIAITYTASLREERERLERRILSPLATLSEESKGRSREEPPCEIRTSFQRDIDRIIHSKAFRRLKHKTQVFLQPEGDHYRTRLTHTLEVARIGRTIARALSLNEDLAEAIAIGHDLGHTPFGHAGERALNEIQAKEGGFKHNEQSLRVVDELEKDGKGLNLTFEVRNGILCHTGSRWPETPEGKVVRIADRIAYINHDVDDAIRAGILAESDIPKEIADAFGGEHAIRINSMIHDIVNESRKQNEITLSPGARHVFDLFYGFMHENVYSNVRAKGEEKKVFGVLSRIYDHYMANPGMLPPDYRRIVMRDGLSRAVGDYLSGMTDKFAVYKYGDLFVPEAWQVR